MIVRKVLRYAARLSVISIAFLLLLSLASSGQGKVYAQNQTYSDPGHGGAVWYECTNPLTGQKYKQLYPCPTDNDTPSTPPVGASTLSYEFDHCNSNSAIVRLKFTWVTGAETYTIWANTTQNSTPSQVVQFTASNFGTSSPKVYDNPVQLGTTTNFWVQTKNRTSSADSNTISVTPSCAPQPASSAGPDGYTFCAKQDGQCTVQAAGMYDLAYGVNGQFVYKLGHSAPISILCDVSTFGTDPSYGNLKSCFYKQRDASSPAITRPGLGGAAQCSNKSPRNILGWDMQDKDTTYTLKKNNVVVYQTKTAAFSPPPPNALRGEASTGKPTYTPRGQYTDTNVTASTTYTYVVEASRGGVTVASPPLRLLTNNCPGTPESFTLSGSAVCAAGKPTTQLRWKPSGNATEYLVLFQLDKPGDPAHGKYLMTGGALAKPGETEVTWVFPGNQTKTMSWKVIAKNNSGEIESNAVQVPLNASACTGPVPTTPVYNLSGQYGHTITGLPANHQWGVFEVQGVRLNGGTIHVKFAGNQSDFSQFSPTYALTEGSPRLDLASVPQIAASSELRAIFTLTAGNNGTTSPQLSSFTTTALAVPPPKTPGPSESLISATPSTGKAPLKVEFEYTRNYIPEAAWTWQFGDGSSEPGNPYFRNKVSHTFEKPGTYSVQIINMQATCLAVGCNVIASKAIEVAAADMASLSVSSISPTSFTTEEISKGATLTVTGTGFNSSTVAVFDLPPGKRVVPTKVTSTTLEVPVDLPNPGFIGQHSIHLVNGDGTPNSANGKIFTLNTGSGGGRTGITTEERPTASNDSPEQNATPPSASSPAAVTQGLNGSLPDTQSTETTNNNQEQSRPHAPRELSSQAKSRTSVELQWEDVSGEDSYVIERRLTTCRFRRIRIVGWRFRVERTCPEFTEVTRIDADSTSYTDSGLRRNTLYEYRVSASNLAGASDDSPTTRVRTRR